QPGRKESLAAAPKAGIDIVADETYGPKDTDVTAQLTKIRAVDGVQAILVFGLGEGPAVVIKDIAQLGVKLPIYQSHGVASEQFIRLAGSAAEGVRLPAAAILVPDQLPDSDPQKAVENNYVALDKGKVRDEIEKTSGFTGTGGVVTMSPQDHLGLKTEAFHMIEIHDGKWKLVECRLQRGRGPRGLASSPTSGSLPVPQLLQYLITGLTVGATYALAGLGFSIVYNASHVINFAQGEFIMLGGMIAAALASAGAPLVVAVPAAIVATAFIGYGVARLAIQPARDSDVTTLIIITIGVSMVLRGGVEATLGKGAHTLPPFSGERPIQIAGAALLPQSVWVVAATLAVVAALAWFFERTRIGKGMLATATNRLAAELVGVRCQASRLAELRPVGRHRRDRRRADSADRQHVLRRRDHARPEGLRRRDARRTRLGRRRGR